MRWFVGLTLLLGSCAALLPDKAAGTLRTSAAYTLSVYATAWQPALLAYARLPYCGKPAVAPCKDRVLYKKLYQLDETIATCSVASVKVLNSGDPDVSVVVACLEQVELAKQAFAKARIVK